MEPHPGAKLTCWISIFYKTSKYSFLNSIVVGSTHSLRQSSINMKMMMSFLVVDILKHILFNVILLVFRKTKENRVLWLFKHLLSLYLALPSGKRLS